MPADGLTTARLAELKQLAWDATQEWDAVAVTCCGLHYANPRGGQHTSKNVSWAVGPPARSRMKAAADAALIKACDPTTVIALVEKAELVGRLKEALTWATGFIRCNFPHTVAPYPDYRNACDLVAEVGAVQTGEFTLTSARAELAEAERDRLRGAVEVVTASAVAALAKYDDAPMSAIAHLDEAVRVGELALGGPVDKYGQEAAKALRHEVATVQEMVLAENRELKAENAGLRKTLADLTAAAEEAVRLQREVNELRER